MIVCLLLVCGSAYFRYLDRSRLEQVCTEARGREDLKNELKVSLLQSMQMYYIKQQLGEAAAFSQDLAIIPASAVRGLVIFLLVALFFYGCSLIHLFVVQTQNNPLIFIVKENEQQRLQRIRLEKLLKKRQKLNSIKQNLNIMGKTNELGSIRNNASSKKHLPPLPKGNAKLSKLKTAANKIQQ